VTDATLVSLADVRAAAGRLAGVVILIVAGFRFQNDDQITARNNAAGVDFHFADLSCNRRRYVHRCLVGLECNQRIVDTDDITRFNEDLDDFYIGKFA